MPTALNYDYRFEIKPNRFVYIQSERALGAARAILREVGRKYDPHQIFFHLGKRGGHVAALRLHQQSKYFSRFDIENFFGQINRSRLSRALREIKIKRWRAFSISWDSVVVENGRKVIPYGFCQSPLLATLALEKSRLGSELISLRSSGLLVSVYMDDILISGPDRDALLAASDAVLTAANTATFPLSSTKRTIAEQTVESFNCSIKDGRISVVDERMAQFVTDYSSATEAGRAAIEKYIAALSPDELERFYTMLDLDTGAEEG